MMTQESSNAILICLKSQLEPEMFVKLLRVFESVGEHVTSELFLRYNRNLQTSLEPIQARMDSFPKDYSVKQHVIIKTKLYSFRYIHDIGRILIIQQVAAEESERMKAEKSLVTLIKILVYHGLMSRSDTDNFALVELEQICSSLNISMLELYKRYQYKLLKIIIKVILRKLEKHNDHSCHVRSSKVDGNSNGNGNGDKLKDNCVIILMTRAFEIFGVSVITSQDFAQSLIIITYLILKDRYREPIALFLRHIARHLDNDIAHLLKSHIQAIMVSLLLRGKMSTFDMTEALKRLCLIAGKKSITELLRTKFTSIKGTLLLHYSIDQKKVREAIEYLGTWDADELDQPFEGQFDDETQFIDHLSPAMIGILLEMDSYFNRNKEVLNSPDGVKYIESLTTIVLKLDEKQVEAIHHKLLSTFGLLLRLRQDRSNQVLNTALINLWHAFLRRIGDDLKETLTLNICVALYDLIDDSPDSVAKLYSDLLLSRNRANTEQFKCLFFIPDCPGFHRIYETITPYVYRGNNKSTLQELEMAINGALPLTKIENQKCHVLAVTRIRDLLKSNQNLLTSSMLVNPEKPLNNIISKTIESLLAILSTKECSALIAECLGIIGAVNPARVDHLIYGDIDASEMLVKINSDDFLVSLIEILKNSLLSDRSSESEKASYALQVIVKGYEVFKRPLLSRLSGEARKACELCKNTSYEGRPRVPPDMSIPLYTKFKNEGHYFYREWLDKFFLVLISYFQDTKIKEVLHACSYNFNYNPKLAEYLLPLVATNLILDQEASRKLIERELMAIINDDIGVSSQDLETVHSPNFEQNMQTLHYQCANIVFRLMDGFARIKKSFLELKAKRVAERAQLKRPCIQSKNELTPEQWNRLNKFTQSIPRDKLAILANKCRAHARSLYYFDHHYFESMIWNPREVTKNVNFDQFWTPLQKVYMALDDIHEAAGIQMRRTSPTTMADDIANFESAGRFDKAILHYESLLETTDQRLDKKPLLEDALRCLSNQGDDQRLYERSKQLIERYPNHKRNILPAAIEAFCKLGKWDELNGALKSEPCQTIMDSNSVCKGQLLNSVVDLSDDTAEKLKMVRRISVKPLSIAMIDRSAYYRGYQNLLSLHSIEDYSLALDVLECKSFQTQRLDENTTDGARRELVDRLRSLFKTWSTRNKLAQPSFRSLEPLLAWQRSITSVLMKKYPFVQPELSRDVGNMWLASAKTAREARSFDRSFYCVAQAQKWFGSDALKANLSLQVECTLAQADIDWDRGESIEAIRSLKASIQRLQGHGLHKHLERVRNMDEDGRRRLNNPYQHPDDESHLEITNINREVICDECSSFDQTERESFAKLKLRLTKYTEDAAASTPRSLITMYGECVHLGVNQEEVFLLLARYYDKLANYYTENPQVLRVTDKDLEGTNSADSCVIRSDKGSTTKASRQKSSSQEKKDKEFAHKEEVISKLMEQSIFAFTHSLKFGATYLEESLPRMLNIWYDLGSKKCLEKMSFYPRAINSRIEKTFRLFDSLLSKQDSSSLPSYYFMAALSLLLSRVCHPHAGISDRTINILAQLLEDYPHQMMWRLAAMCTDETKDRKIAAEKIMKLASKKNAESAKIIRDYMSFINLMRAVTKNCGDYDRRTDKASKAKQTLKSGHCHIRDVEPKCENLNLAGKIIAPTQSSINPILPTGNDRNNLRNYKIYPDQYMSFIHKFGTDVYVYNSLQKPRKINFIVEDGKSLSIICKAGDDLRKDSRCIEFFNLLNRILRRGAQSNMRFFEITTFLVLPLENRVGMIEMVPNCATYRSVIDNLYREEHGEVWNPSDHQKKRQYKEQYPDAEMYQHFLERVLPKTKCPVFQRFFQRRFTDPTTWYMARLAYTRSTALISIAGYIIGLGDRHLDNVLIDLDQGRAVHVDFNLLFHQAETLPVPEAVPFRMTQNVVAGLGPMGTEGSFRRYSEIALRIMRNEKELLLTTLKPFLHDPCCDWTKDREQNRKSTHGEPERDGNKTARDRIEVVEKKLRGFPKPGGQAKPLTVLNAFSVEAQVDILIEEATSLWNLSQMYYGWAPHI